MSQTLKALKDIVEIMAKTYLPNDWKYLTANDFVIQFGKTFEYQPLPSKYKKMTPKYCFNNSMRLSLRRKNLVYVEGYAAIPSLSFPIYHAWCVEIGSNKVIDPTTDSLRDYIGVPFKREVVEKKCRDKTSSCALIDDMENKWPLLKMSKEQVLRLIDDTV